MQKSLHPVSMTIESGGALLASVQRAINTLGCGFLAHPANHALRDKLRDGRLPLQDYYRQILRLVYRLIMLFMAEKRGILPHFQPVLNGFLFSPQAIPDLERCILTDQDLLSAVRCLIFTDNDLNGRCSVDYKNLSCEELGSIYESLLEMRPKLDMEAAIFVLKAARGNERKMSGSYYTPASLIDCLLDSALEPALAEACSQPNAEQSILNLKICDPACGSGHFLIAAARRIAKRLAAVRAGNEEPGPQVIRAALRAVMSLCIYGVDIDPMAVELCKVSLWMEVIEPGRPFPSLDAHIQCGNSLLGATPALLTQQPPDGACKGMDSLDSVDDMDNRLWADAWCAALMWKKADQLAYPVVKEILRNGEKQLYSMEAWTEVEIKRLAEQYRFFHWHQAFPDVFHLPGPGEAPQNEQAGWSGGFDVVLGNPPYLFGENHDRRTNSMIKALFRLATGQFDASWLFIEHGLKLIGEHGRLALVVPDALLTRDEARKTRELMLQQGLECICYCGTAFKASVSTIIFVVAKGCETGTVLSKALDGVVVNTRYRCNKQRFQTDPKHRFLTHMSDEEAAIFSRIESACQPLGRYAKISRGEELGKKDVHTDGPIPILVGDDISRYFLRKPSRFLHKIKKDAMRYRAPKIVITKTGSKCIASLDHSGYVTMQSVYNLHLIAPDLTYESLLALLNSRFVDCFIFKTFTSYKLLFPQLNQSTIGAIPVPTFTKKVREEIDALVRCIQNLKIEMMEKSMTADVSHINGKVENLNMQIDRVIYEAYGVAAREIEIIESNMP
jgi:methylase of polypeptide subunit release factors